MPRTPRSAFTLIELLIVIAIVAVVAVVVILVINPAELLRQARDSNRLSDLATVNEALGIFLVNNTSLGVASTTYISIPDPSATSTAGDQCQGLSLPGLPSGWSYHCASPASYKNVDGTGWMPVNFRGISSGSPISNLPVDPQNQSSTNFYYTYTTDGTKYELTSMLESSKYKATVVKNPLITNFPGVYAQGTNLALSALWSSSGVVGYWPLDEGSGSSTVDASGNGGTGTLINSPTWTTSCKENSCLSFNGSNNSVNVTNNNNTLDIGTNDFSIAAWIQTPAIGGANRNMFDKGGEASIGLGFLVSYSFPGQLYLAIHGHTNAAAASNGRIDDNGWHFVVVSVVRSGNATFYIDGAADTGGGSVSSESADSLTNAYQASIGSFTPDAGGGEPFSGLIDDLRFYKRAISAAEIRAIYNAEK